MKILMLTSVYPQPDDGLYKTTPTVQYFCREWVKQGHNVIVIHNNTVLTKLIYSLPRKIKEIIEKKFQLQIPSKESLVDIYRVDNGVKVFRKKIIKLIPHSKFSHRKIIKHGNKIIELLKQEGFIPDIIVGHWANPQVELIDYIINKLDFKRNSAIVFHDDCTVRNVKKYHLKKYIRNITNIGCRNKTMGIYIKKNLNLKYSPFVCNSGLDNEIVESVNIEDCINSKEINSILYVGRLQRYKHVESIIEAIFISNYNKWNFTIVGEGTEFNKINQLIEKYELKESYTYISSLFHKDVFEIMKKKEIFTMISENEVFGMVYFEAMLMGCITIATRGSAADGYIIDGVNGFLCEQGNSKELAAIYDRISHMTREQREEMMRNAHNTAKKLKDENVAKDYLENIISENNKKIT